MIAVLRRKRADVEADLARNPRRRYVSPAFFGMHRELERVLPEHMRGRVLDVGCGAQPYRRMMGESVTAYDGFDIEERAPDVRYIGDAQRMDAVPSGCYDSVLCTEVLEHVPEPRMVLGEIRRVLASDGTLVLTTPFLARLHEEPHDYYRYTVWGLRHLLGREDFEVVSIEPTGSIFSLVGHQAATVTLSLVWGLKGFRSLVFWLNAALVTLPCYHLDRLLRLRNVLPLNYVTVAQSAHS